MIAAQLVQTARQARQVFRGQLDQQVHKALKVLRVRLVLQVTWDQLVLQDMVLLDRLVLQVQLV